MAILLFVSLSGLSCTGLFGPEDAPIRVENETDFIAYSADAEIVITLKNIGKKRIGVENLRSVQQWNGQEWVDGPLIHAPDQGVMDPSSCSNLVFSLAGMGTLGSPPSVQSVASFGRLRGIHRSLL